MVEPEHNIEPTEEKALEIELSLAISGRVWDDQNVNGTMDALEEGVEGALIVLSEGGDTLQTFVTDATGEFMMIAPKPGTFVLTETDPVDWVSTSSVPGTGSCSQLDANNLQIEISYADLFRGTPLTGNLFGDVYAPPTPITILGRVWEDRDADGMMDPDEPGLGGVNVGYTQGGMGDVYSDAEGHFQQMGSQDAVGVLYIVDAPLDFFPSNALPGVAGWKITGDSIGIDALAVPRPELVSDGHFFGLTPVGRPRWQPGVSSQDR
jgi:hypothetical protein